MHGLIEEYLSASEPERLAILDKINTALLKIEKQKSARDSLTVDTSFMRAFAQFRQSLRNLLAEYGIRSNPGWTDEDIICAFRELLSNKQTQKTG